MNRIERGIFKALLTPSSIILRPLKPRSRTAQKSAIVDISTIGGIGWLGRTFMEINRAPDWNGHFASVKRGQRHDRAAGGKLSALSP
jgi:hypothetical protein